LFIRWKWIHPWLSVNVFYFDGLIIPLESPFLYRYDEYELYTFCTPYLDNGTGTCMWLWSWKNVQDNEGPIFYFISWICCFHGNDEKISSNIYVCLIRVYFPLTGQPGLMIIFFWLCSSYIGFKHCNISAYFCTSL
jgi:hypothetical protein